MNDQNMKKSSAAADFKRMMLWIVLAAVVMVAGALIFAALTTELTVHMVVAMIGGVLFSVVLGSGLFALAFFSDKSGHDETVTQASRQTRSPDESSPEQR